MARWMGVDVGTTTVTAVVVDGNGTVEAVASEANDAETTSRDDRRRGRSEWDAERMLEAALCAMKAAGIGAKGAVDGVGVTGQMHGMLLARDDGSAEGPFVGWQDRRGSEKGAGHEASTVERIDAFVVETGLGERVCRPKAGYLGPTLLALKESGAPVTSCTASFMPDWVVARLTGTTPVTDRTNAAGSGLYDAVSDAWADAVIEGVGLGEAKLPALRPCASRAGEVSAEFADATGLASGTPVCVACGDNQASFAGSVGSPDDTVLVNVGTGGQMSLRTDTKRADADLELRPYLDGGYLLVGAGVVGGRTFAWLRDFLADVGESVFGVDVDRAAIYARMNALAADIAEGAEGLTAEPVLTGTRSQPDKRGRIDGIGTTNFTAGHLTRAVIEGMAAQFRLLYAQAIASGAQARTRLVGSGNGIRQNAVLRRAVETVFDMKMAVPVHREEAAYGAALVAGVGCGGWSGWEAAGRGVRYSMDSEKR